MKELIGLLFLICIAAITLYLSVQRQIDIKLTSLFLCFALLGGFAIARYDLIKSFQWKDVKLETFQRDVDQIKSEALSAIQKDIKTQRDSLELVIADANETRRKLEDLKKGVEDLYSRTVELGKSAKEQQKKLAATALRSEDTEKRIIVLGKASNDLALLLTRISWLQIETKSEFGTPRVQKAVEEILAELNRIVMQVIPDQSARNQWITDLQNSLPKR